MASDGKRIEIEGFETIQSKPIGGTRCPTCGPTTTEPHPRLPGVVRCVNCREHLSTTPDAVYRAAAEAPAMPDDAAMAAADAHAAEGYPAHGAAAATAVGWQRGWVAGYAAGHVNGTVAERGRLTRLIRRHANSAATPLSVSNALSRIVDEMEGTDA